MLARASSGIWQHLLLHNNHHPEPSIPPVRVSLVAVRVRYLIEQLISVEIKVALGNASLRMLVYLVDGASFKNHNESSVESRLGGRWRR